MVPWWSDNLDYMMLYLKSEQQYATDKLRACKHIFLNEILERLDLPKTPEGQLAGWVWTPEYEEDMGDGFVDFNIDVTFRENPDFPNGLERVITLDFNCDGNIYELMKTKKHERTFA